MVGYIIISVVVAVATIVLMAVAEQCKHIGGFIVDDKVSLKDVQPGGWTKAVIVGIVLGAADLVVHLTLAGAWIALIPAALVVSLVLLFIAMHKLVPEDWGDVLLVLLLVLPFAFVAIRATMATARCFTWGGFAWMVTLPILVFIVGRAIAAITGNWMRVLMIFLILISLVGGGIFAVAQLGVNLGGDETAAEDDSEDGDETEEEATPWYTFGCLNSNTKVDEFGLNPWHEGMTPEEAYGMLKQRSLADPLVGTNTVYYRDSVSGNRYLQKYYEAHENDTDAINEAIRYYVTGKNKTDNSEFAELVHSSFAWLDKHNPTMSICTYKELKDKFNVEVVDQVYANPHPNWYDADGFEVPADIVYECGSDTDGHYLVIQYGIKHLSAKTLMEVYHIECGFQSCNNYLVERVVVQERPSGGGNSSNPKKGDGDKSSSPKKGDGGGTSSKPKYNKNPDDMKGGDAEKNDDTGNGGKTIGTEDSNHSTEDKSKSNGNNHSGGSSSSDNKTPAEYNQNNADTGKKSSESTQQTGGSSDKTSTQNKATTGGQTINAGGDDWGDGSDPT